MPAGLPETAKFNCLFYDFTEIFVSIFFPTDMFHTIPAYYIRAVNPVFVGISQAHQAVGGHQDTAWNVVKLFLLILPGSTEVTYKMRIFFSPS